MSYIRNWLEEHMLERRSVSANLKTCRNCIYHVPHTTNPYNLGVCNAFHIISSHSQAENCGDVEFKSGQHPVFPRVGMSGFAERSEGVASVITSTFNNVEFAEAMIQSAIQAQLIERETLDQTREWMRGQLMQERRIESESTRDEELNYNSRIPTYIPTLQDLEHAQGYLVNHKSERRGAKIRINLPIPEEPVNSMRPPSPTFRTFSMVFVNSDAGWIYEGRVRIGD